MIPYITAVLAYKTIDNLFLAEFLVSIGWLQARMIYAQLSIQYAVCGTHWSDETALSA